MKTFSFFIFIALLSCNSINRKLTSNEVLKKSIKFHDSKNKWNSVNFTLQIQEPRINNPKRYSVVSVNNKTGAFQLERNRDNHVSTHQIDASGNSITMLDKKIITDSLIIKKYRLQKNRNFGYQRFYQILLGLPMSLQNEKFLLEKEYDEVLFDEEKVYQLKLVLKEALFSKNWNLYISKKEFSLVGVEMIFPEDDNNGERIVFDGKIEIEDLIISRFRHWYEIDNTYSGSDIILNQIN